MAIYLSINRLDANKYIKRSVLFQSPTYMRHTKGLVAPSVVKNVYELLVGKFLYQNRVCVFSFAPFSGFVAQNGYKLTDGNAQFRTTVHHRLLLSISSRL